MPHDSSAGSAPSQPVQSQLDQILAVVTHLQEMEEQRVRREKNSIRFRLILFSLLFVISIAGALEYARILMSILSQIPT